MHIFVTFNYFAVINEYLMSEEDSVCECNYKTGQNMYIVD